MNNFWNKLNKPIIAVAPMDGVTDCAFRSICKDNGADVLYTEFVTVDGIFHALDKVKTEMSFTNKQRPVVIQLFGNNPQLFKHAAGEVEKAGADGVDINFGCPSKRVVQHGSGVKLMTNLDLVYQIVEATLSGVKKIPVSIKMRAGINVKPKDQESSALGVEKVTAVQMIQKIKNLPFSAVMIHGRTYEQGFSGDLDIEQIRQVKKLVGERIVLVNGGITSPENAKKILEETKVDGIGIGRGVLGKPWLLQQIKDYLMTGSYSEPNSQEIKKIILKHAKLLYKNKGDHGLLELRKHLSWYVKGIPSATQARKKLVQIESVDEVKTILKNLVL